MSDDDRNLRIRPLQSQPPKVVVWLVLALSAIPMGALIIAWVMDGIR